MYEVTVLVTGPDGEEIASVVDEFTQPPRNVGEICLVLSNAIQQQLMAALEAETPAVDPPDLRIVDDE